MDLILTLASVFLTLCIIGVVFIILCSIGLDVQAKRK